MELFDVGLELPVMVADEDFIEYLAEEGFDESIEEAEAAEYFLQWMKENCEH